MHSSTLNPIGNAAIAYATRGFAVFPCMPRGKVPATHHGCRDATKNLALITAWWRENPRYNVAVASGTISKVFILDVDGLDAEASLRKLEEQYGALPDTIESITRRGRHLFFRCENGAVWNSAGAIAPGLDIRGDGGYVVLPPSIHPSGRPYVWSVDSADHFAEAPTWLISLLGSGNNRNCRWQAKLPEHWHSTITSAIRNGAVHQMVGLERRAARGGRDTIDHGRGGHDDVCNAVAGAVVIADRLPAGWRRREVRGLGLSESARPSNTYSDPVNPGTIWMTRR
jgi:Bifunctional DNA primase/polymerase, N-terminal